MSADSSKFTQIGLTYPGQTAGTAATIIIAATVVCLEFFDNRRFPTEGATGSYRKAVRGWDQRGRRHGSHSSKTSSRTVHVTKGYTRGSQQC